MPKKTTKKPGADLSEFRKPMYVETTAGIGLCQTKPLKRPEIIKQLSKLTNERLEALSKHFKIPASSPDKWKLLSFHLGKELGLIDITLKKPMGPGAPRIWLQAGTILIERMDELSAKQPDLTPLQVAAILKNKYPDDYGHLTKKSIVNRHGEAKQRSGMGMSASIAERRAAMGQELRQLRASRKRGANPRVVSRYENYLATELQRLQVIKK